MLIYMGGNLAPKCHEHLLVLAADMGIAWVSAPVDRRRCEYCQGNTDVHMGGTLAPKCHEHLLVLAADMSIAWVRVRSIGVDVSIATGIQFIWEEH